MNSISTKQQGNIAKESLLPHAQRMASMLVLLLLIGAQIGAVAAGFNKSEFIFPQETWHNHASSIVEAPNGDLIVCWFHGSGERTADDVKIEGARLRKGESKWSERFTMADTPGYPDTNCALFIDPQGRLWLLWPTILANRWESALMKYRISTNYLADGPPEWSTSEVLHLSPGAEFVTAVEGWVKQKRAELKSGRSDLSNSRARAYLDDIERQAQDKLTRRLGWMTRAHPVVISGGRMIVPLYSDGFSFSLMAFTDDWGLTWRTSAPLCGDGNIQPTVVERKDGSLYALMRDNGPAPKRLHQSISRDRGETWSEVTDSRLPNPGAGAELIKLQNGRWLLISNDTEKGRGRLAVQISDDEGLTWEWKRYLENDDSLSGTEQYHYPSIIQAKDGTLHATYSYHWLKPNLPVDPDGDPAGKTIKHVHFNEEWIRGE
ncbi:MAG: sialidase family protein [Limisphaerales bacterium]